MTDPCSPLRRILAVALLALPLAAPAFTASNTRPLNVREGPGTQFLVLRVLPARTAVSVRGCINGWQWCEIEARRTRGWVDSRFLQPSVRGQVPIVRHPKQRERQQRPVG